MKTALTASLAIYIKIYATCDNIALLFYKPIKIQDILKVQDISNYLCRKEKDRFLSTHQDMLFRLFSKRIHN